VVVEVEKGELKVTVVLFSFMLKTFHTVDTVMLVALEDIFTC